MLDFIVMKMSRVNREKGKAFEGGSIGSNVEEQRIHSPGGGGATPYNGLYREAPPERGTFFFLQVYKRVGISQVEVYKRVEKSIIYVFKRPFNYNISNRRPLWLYQFIY